LTGVFLPQWSNEYFGVCKCLFVLGVVNVSKVFSNFGFELVMAGDFLAGFLFF